MPHLDNTTSSLANTEITLKSSQMPISAATFAIFQNMTTMDTYLMTKGWTQARLDLIGKNDKIAECRMQIGAALAPVK